MDKVLLALGRNDVLVFFITLILFTIVFGIIIHRLFKNSHIARISFLFFIISMVMCLLAYLVGRFGPVHILWGAPLSFVLLVFMFRFWKNRIQVNLRQVTRNLERIAHGFQ